MRTRPNGCTGRKPDNTPCLAPLVPGTDRCRWHPSDEAARERHREESRRGGLSKAYGQTASAPPLAECAEFIGLDMGTADGLRGFLSLTLAQLARLPFDCRVANAIGQIATAQRGTIETSDLEARLAALEGRT